MFFLRCCAVVKLNTKTWLLIIWLECPQHTQHLFLCVSAKLIIWRVSWIRYNFTNKHHKNFFLCSYLNHIFGRKQILCIFITKSISQYHIEETKETFSLYLLTWWRSRFYFIRQIRHLVRFVEKYFMCHFPHFPMMVNKWNIVTTRERRFSQYFYFHGCNTIASVIFESTSLFICYINSISFSIYDALFKWFR